MKSRIRFFVHYYEKFLKLKEGLKKSQVVKEVIGNRTRCFKKNYMLIKPMLSLRSSIKKHVSPLKINRMKDEKLVRSINFEESFN